MPRTPAERITVQVTARPTLARVVRTAVLWQCRASGLEASRAAALAQRVERRFVVLARRLGTSRPGLVRLSIESGEDGLMARIGSEGNSAPSLFRARARKKAAKGRIAKSRGRRRSRPR